MKSHGSYVKGKTGIGLLFPLSQWAKSPKKQSVGVYFAELTKTHSFFWRFAHWVGLV